MGLLLPLNLELLLRLCFPPGVQEQRREELYGLLSLLALLLVLLSRWLPGLRPLRRGLGLAGFGYGLLHGWLAVDHVLEGDPGNLLFLNPSTQAAIWAGVVALALLLPLALTSTTSARRYLGRRWKTLHRLGPPMTLLAALHTAWGGSLRALAAALAVAGTAATLGMAVPQAPLRPSSSQENTMKLRRLLGTPKLGGLLRTLPLLAALGLPAARAHEIARDGNVGGLIHIEPDDAPLVGKPNPASFEVNQRGGRAILLSQCACHLSVYAGVLRPGARPSSTPKLSQGKGELNTTLTFPAAGAYTLVLQGRPRAGAGFPPFTLKWTVRADFSAGSAAGGHSH